MDYFNVFDTIRKSCFILCESHEYALIKKNDIIENIRNYWLIHIAINNLFGDVSKVVLK